MQYLVDKNIPLTGSLSLDELEKLFEIEVFQPIRDLEAQLGPTELTILVELHGIGCIGIEASDDTAEKLRAMGYTLHKDTDVYPCDD